MPLTAGTRLGRYEVHSQIGVGGMGEVYLAQDMNLGRRVALKLLPSEFTKDEGRVRRFQQEARAASALNHPNILTIHEIGSENSTYFIATEYIEGRTLRDSMAGAPMKTSEVLDVATQVASALAAAHAAGVVHRDIKPENIMLRHDRIVKVLDFGLAKLTERETTDTEAPTLVNTDAGVDHIGPMTGSVVDAAIVLKVIGGYDPDDTTSYDMPVDDYAAGLSRKLRWQALTFGSMSWHVTSRPNSPSIRTSTAFHSGRPMANRLSSPPVERV
jgi:serine/threonine protein kinase